MRNGLTAFNVMAVACAFALLLLPCRCLAITGMLLPKDEDQVVSFRLAGLHGDRTQIPAIIAGLKSSTHPDYTRAALHALAQLGATEALPLFDAQAKSDADPDLRNYAEVARARLQAEGDVAALTASPAKAASRISAFYQYLGLSPTAINAGVKHFYDAGGANPPGGGAPPAKPIEVYALREVADMVYLGTYSDYSSLPGVSALDFSPDFAAALKMRLAPLSQPKRIAQMIQDLIHKDKELMNDSFEIQLLADEGLPAANAVSAQLNMMGQQRSQYPDEGFDMLFDVLRGIGDKTQAPIVAKYQNDDTVGYYARLDFYKLQQGLKTRFMVGY